MADSTPIEKLQPCLLDRLTDDEPDKREESRLQRVMSIQKYRKGVLRDLDWLFNTSAYLSLDGVEAFSLKDFPEVQRSVLNFGIRQLCGITAPSPEQLQEEIASVVQIFEPRISSRSLTIHADRERNVITLEIEGDLWSHPVPEHLHVRTAVDVETGQTVFGDSAYGSSAA